MCSASDYGVRMSVLTEVQYVSDAEGQVVGVIVPIDLWREITSERETAHLLRREAMRQRLLEAKGRTRGVTPEGLPARFAGTATDLEHADETLFDFLAGYVGTIDGTTEALSEDCGRRFADGMAEKQRQ